MVATDPSRVVEALARRGDLLTALEDGPKEKRELEDILSVSRSTVDRAVRRLETVGLVSRGDGAVRLTLAGRMVLTEYEACRDGLVGLREAWSFLDPVPPDAGLSLDLFRRGTFVPSDRHAPHQPVRVLKSILEGADRIRGVATAVLPEYVDLYHQLIVEQGTEVELVVSTPVLSELLENFTTPFEASLRTGRLQIREVSESPPVSTILAHDDDPEVAVVVYGDGGTAGLIRNDSDAAVEWARSWIEDWESRGDLIASENRA